MVVTTTFVINEFLCYVFDAKNRDTQCDIVNVVTEFYCDDAVIDAKDVLWQHFDKDIGAKVSRRESQSQTRRKKNVDDIVKAVSKIDETYPEEDLRPVIFVAKDLCKLPCKSSNSANDNNNVENRVKILELQMAELLTNKTDNPVIAPNQVRREIPHNLPRRNIQTNQTLNNQRHIQRVVDNATGGEIVNNAQTRTENPRSSYADMASNPDGIWKDVRPKSRPKAVFGTKKQYSSCC